MTLPISKNQSLFKENRFVFYVLTAAASFLAGNLLSWASDARVSSNKISAKKPVSISSSQLTFDKLKGLTLFKGKVKALHGTVILTADEIRAFTENNVATAKGHVKVVDKNDAVTLTCGNLEYQNLMDMMTAHDHPILTRADNNGKSVTMLGRQIVLDSDERTVVVDQNVQIIQAESEAEAQKATYFGNENKLILENDPRVYTSSAQISARRITTDLGEKKTFFAEGLADCLFNPSGAPLPVKSKNDDKNQGAAGKNGDASNNKKSDSLKPSETPGAQPTAFITPGTASYSATAAPSPDVLGR
jgi:lipopolysaccharide transport protein LptA